MKVKFEHGGVYVCGIAVVKDDVVDLPDKIARDQVRLGYAVKAGKEDKVTRYAEETEEP